MDNAKPVFALVLAVALALAGLLGYRAWLAPNLRIEEVLGGQMRKAQIAAQMRLDLALSVEAEKNALLTEEPEAARTFARRSTEAARAVEAGRAALEELIARNALPEQRRFLDDFDRAWSEVRQIDSELLDMAVQKTNAQAARLSRTEGMQGFDRLAASLEKALALEAGKPQAGAFTAACFTALAGAARMLALQAPHIEEASDSGMDIIETQMRQSAFATRQALIQARAMADGEAAALVDEAVRAFEAFEVLNARIVTLSRVNSDVKSLALSMERKRLAAAACEAALAGLQHTINERLAKATR